MTFHRIELVDIGDKFPTLIDEAFHSETDLLIVANGFEDRSTRFATTLAERGKRVPQAATIHYDTNQTDNEQLLSALKKALQILGAVNTPVPIESIPDDIAALVVRAGQNRPGEPVRVTFDVSGASGRVILRVIRTLFHLTREGAAIELTVAYTEATTYSPTKDQADERLAALQPPEDPPADWLPTDPMSVGPDWEAHDAGAEIEYPGQSAEGLGERAVVLCGFNADRVRVALDAVDPAFNADMPHDGVAYIVGRPPADDLAWRLEVMRQINAYGGDTTKFDFHESSTLHYFETLHRLEDLYKASFGSQRMTVIPFGSKMQTLAAALFCELHPDVRAYLVAPRRYTGADYSTGSGPTHTLTFGHLGELTEAMAGLGDLIYDRPENAMTGWTTETT